MSDVSLPDRQLFDLAGPEPSDKLKAVRIFPTGTGAWAVYGESRAHPQGEPVADGVVLVRLIDGDLAEIKPHKRWAIGPYTLARAAGCGCGSRLGTLRAFTP